MHKPRLTPPELEKIAAPPSAAPPRMTWTQVQEAQQRADEAKQRQAQEKTARTQAGAVGAQGRLPGIKPTGGEKKRQGNAAEEAFRQGCDLAGVRMVRIPEPSRPVGTPRPAHIRDLGLPLPRLDASGHQPMPYRVCRMEAAQAVDFEGHIRARQGRPLPLYAEVKSVEITDHDSALRWSPDARLLLPHGELGHQGRILERAGQDGCAALVFLVRLGGTDPGTPSSPQPRTIPSRTYLLPWPQSSPRTQAPPRESWRWEDLDARGWGVPVGRCWWEALASAEAWEAYREGGWEALANLPAAPTAQNRWAPQGVKS